MEAPRIETYSIVGTRYRGNGAQRVVNSLDKGAKVKLIRDPFNDFDKNAVQVWIKGVHVGYVCASEAILLAAYMDARQKQELTGIYTRSGRDFWPSVKVELEN